MLPRRIYGKLVEATSIGHDKTQSASKPIAHLNKNTDLKLHRDGCLYNHIRLFYLPPLRLKGSVRSHMRLILWLQVLPHS